MEAQTLPEFLVVVLNHVADKKPDSHRLLPQNPQILHKAFFDLRQRYSEAFPALGQLHFITAGAFPYSPDLTEAMDTLQFSGAISRENPSYDKFTLKTYQDTSEWLKEETSRLTGADPAKSEELGRLIDELAEALT